MRGPIAIMMLAVATLALAFAGNTAGIPAGLLAAEVQPALPAGPASPEASSGATAQETRGLEEAISELNQDPAALDSEDRSDIREDIRSQIDNVKEDLDDIEEDLDERADEIDLLEDDDDVDDSEELARAEAKQVELEERLRGIRDRTSDIRGRATFGADISGLLGEVRALGSDIAALELAIRTELDPLIDVLEDLAD